MKNSLTYLERNLKKKYIESKSEVYATVRRLSNYANTKFHTND